MHHGINIINKSKDTNIFFFLTNKKNVEFLDILPTGKNTAAKIRINFVKHKSGNHKDPWANRDFLWASHLIAAPRFFLGGEAGTAS